MKSVQYNYKSTTAFDDQFSYGIEAEEIGHILPEAVLSFVPPIQNNIVMFAGGTEMLKVADDGFYVRGVKVEQDDKEAERVYNAFKQFLVWSELNRR